MFLFFLPAFENVYITVVSSSYFLRSYKLLSLPHNLLVVKIGRGIRNRTEDLVAPNHAHYLAVLYPDVGLAVNNAPI